MKHCQICNAYFDAPMVREGTDPTVFPGYRYRDELCPVCGQPYIEDAAVCPICKGYMPAGSILWPVSGTSPTLSGKRKRTSWTSGWTEEASRKGASFADGK